MSETQLDAWEELQKELAKVEALHRAHPELFRGVTVSFDFCPGLDRSSVGFHADRDVLYAFAKKHQDVKWLQNSLGNWKGHCMGLSICLFSMRKPSDTQPIVFPATEDPTIGKDAGFLGTMGIVPRKEPEFI